MIKNIKIMEFLRGLLILVIIFFILNFKSIDLNISLDSILENNTITISGKAERQVFPDTARISFSINEYKKDQKIAADIVNKKTKKIIEVIREIGIEEKDIKTKNYSVYPQYNWNNGKRSFQNYRVSQSVELKIRDLDNISKVLASVIKLEVDNLNGPNMFIDKIGEIKDSLREEAIKNAKNKAKIIALELGVNLDKIVSFSENDNDFNRPVYYEKSSSFKIESSESISEPEINLGEEKIIKTVSITFKIKD